MKLKPWSWLELEARKVVLDLVSKIEKNRIEDQKVLIEAVPLGGIDDRTEAEIPPEEPEAPPEVPPYLARAIEMEIKVTKHKRKKTKQIPQIMGQGLLTRFIQVTKCIDLPNLQSLHNESQDEISKSNNNSCDRDLTETEEVCGGGVHGQTVAERSQDIESHKTGVGPPGSLAKKTGRPPDRIALREGKVQSMVRKLEPRRGENKVEDEKGMESKVLEMVKVFEPEVSKKRIILTPRRRKPDGLSSRSIVE